LYPQDLLEGQRKIDKGKITQGCGLGRNYTPTKQTRYKTRCHCGHHSTTHCTQTKIQIKHLSQNQTLKHTSKLSTR
jgi:hypothetical protein